MLCVDFPLNVMILAIDSSIPRDISHRQVKKIKDNKLKDNETSLGIIFSTLGYHLWRSVLMKGIW